MRRLVAALVLVLGLVAAAPALADDGFDPTDFAWRPHPGALLPLAAGLIDEAGHAVTLRRYFTGRPAILVLDYLRCKTLCGVTLDNILAALDRLPLDAGRDYRLIAISIDPRDTPADAMAARSKHLAAHHRRGADAGVDFLVGTAPAVGAIAGAVGFPYRYDKALDQYIHPAGFVVASGAGRISRYVEGVSVTPALLSAAIADAQQEKAPGPLTRLLLLCRGGSALLGRYTVPVLAAFTVADIAATIALIAIFAAIRRRRQG